MTKDTKTCPLCGETEAMKFGMTKCERKAMSQFMGWWADKTREDIKERAIRREEEAELKKARIKRKIQRLVAEL